MAQPSLFTVNGIHQAISALPETFRVTAVHFAEAVEGLSVNLFLPNLGLSEAIYRTVRILAWQTFSLIFVFKLSVWPLYGSFPYVSLSL